MIFSIDLVVSFDVLFESAGFCDAVSEEEERPNVPHNEEDALLSSFLRPDGSRRGGDDLTGSADVTIGAIELERPSEAPHEGLGV